MIRAMPERKRFYFIEAFPNDYCIKEASIRYYNTYQYIPIIPDGIKEASVAPKTIAVKPSHTASIASKL